MREQGLTISNSAPPSVQPDEPITYTLTVANLGKLPATNLVITDTIPEGTAYLNGGIRVGNVISWTIPNLPVANSVQVSFMVLPTNSTFISNKFYGVQAEGSIDTNKPLIVPGDQVINTVVANVTAYLPLILKKLRVQVIARPHPQAV